MPCFAYIMLLLLYIATVYILNFLRTKIFVHGLLNFPRKHNLQNKNFMDRLPSTHSYTHIYVASFQGWKCHSCLTNHDMHVNLTLKSLIRPYGPSTFAIVATVVNPWLYLHIHMQIIHGYIASYISYSPVVKLKATSNSPIKCRIILL